jgi:hypothetical protein
MITSRGEMQEERIPQIVAGGPYCFAVAAG